MNSGCTCIFSYTSDNAEIAKEEMRQILKDNGFLVNKVEIVEETRACRNAYGKEVSKEELEGYDPESDEAWFNDYDFVIRAEVMHNELADADLVEWYLRDHVSEFVCFEEEYEKNGEYEDR